MLNLLVFILLQWLGCSIVDTSVHTSQSFLSEGSEAVFEVSRNFQWGLHLVRNIPMETTISSDVYFFGGYVELKFKKIIIDDSCHVSKCSSCNGTKQFDKDYESHQHSLHVHKHISYPCPRCLGLGITVDEGQRCQPYSYDYVAQNYFIPSGLFVNDIATLAKEGNEIYENGERTTGSLLVSISNIYSNHETILIQSHCVNLIVKLTPAEALFGFVRHVNLTGFFETASIAIVGEEGDSKIDVIKDELSGTVLVLDRTNLVTSTPMKLTLKSFVVFPHNPASSETNSSSDGISDPPSPPIPSKTQDLVVDLQLYTVEGMQQQFLDQHRYIRASTVSTLCPPSTATVESDVINLDGSSFSADGTSQCEALLYQEYVYNVTVRAEEILYCQKQQEDVLSDRQERQNHDEVNLDPSQRAEAHADDVPDWFDANYAQNIGTQWNEMTAKDQLIRRMLFILKSRQSS